MGDSKRLPEALPPLAQGASQLVIGYSGGLDSTVLCHWLSGQTGLPPLLALHVNHGLQSAAADFESHCLRQAKVWGLALEVEHAVIPAAARQSLGLEAAARQARQQAFLRRAEAQPGTVVVLAHHLNDQVETALLQWMRGAGLEGLCAMEGFSSPTASRPYAIWRPLLALTKAELHDMAQAAGLSWIEDPSNESLAMDRNRLRHQVMPVLEDMRAGVIASMGRSIEHLQTARRLVEELAQLDLQACRMGQDDIRSAEDRDQGQASVDLQQLNGLQLTRLLSLSDDRMAACLRLWIRQAGHLLPPARRLAECCRQLREARPGASVQLAVRPDATGGQEAFQVRLRAGVLTLEPLAPHEN